MNCESQHCVHAVDNILSGSQFRLLPNLLKTHEPVIVVTNTVFSG